MKTICLYHRSDLDGHCSGAIVKHFVPEAEMIGVEYGDKILESPELWNKLDGARVYLVDFSLQPWSEMQRLAAFAAELIWIDHHKTAIDELEKHGWGEESRATLIFTTLNTKFAACELAWCHFTAGTPEQIPLAVRLLGRYDVWDHAFNPDVLPFQMGMRLEDTDPQKDFNWGHLFEADENGQYREKEIIVKSGLTVLTYQKQQNARLMGLSFVHTWRGYRWLAVNASGTNSMAFDSKFDPAVHDGVISFYYDGSTDVWKFSMYSPDQKHDFSGIAKEMGGGGHPCACGFQLENLGSWDQDLQGAFVNL